MFFFPFTNLSKIQKLVLLLLELLPILSQSWNLCEVLSKTESVHTPKLTIREIEGSAGVLSVVLTWSSIDQRSCDHKHSTCYFCFGWEELL